MTRVYASSQQLMDSSAIVCNCLHAFFPATYILHENYTGSGREIPIVKLMKVLKDQFPAITSVGFDSPHGAMLLITRFGHEVIVTDDSRTEDEHLDLYTLDKELYTAGRLLASPEIDHAQFLTRTVAPKLSMPALLPASTLRIRDTPSSEIRTVITYQAVYPVFNASGHFHIPMSERGILLIFEPSGNIIACNKADSRSAVGTGIVQVKDSPDPIIAGMLQHVNKRYRGLTRLPSRVQSTFKVGGETVLLDIRKIESLYNSNWYVALAVPENDFLGKAKHSRNTTVLISIGLALFGIVISAYLGSALASPLARISAQMRNVLRLQLETSRDESVKIVQEIEEIEASFEAMTSGLVSFSKYVPLHIIRSVLSNNLEAHLGVQPTVCTVCFIDVVNFTAMSETLSIDIVMEVMGECFEDFSNIIMASGGTIDKYIGDSIMAFWNTPEQPVENHEQTAIAACLSCQARLVELRAKWRESSLPELTCCIGLASGNAFVGNVGSKGRLNYTVMGETVNLAARIEPLNRVFGTSILVDRSLYEITNSQFEFCKIGSTTVKGLRNIIELYEPLCLLSTASPEPHDETKVGGKTSCEQSE